MTLVEVGITVAAIAAWIMVGAMVTTAYAFGRVKLKKQAMSEIDLAWLVVGWPLTFFGALGLALQYATKRMEEQERLRAANEGQVPTVVSRQP